MQTKLIKKGKRYLVKGRPKGTSNRYPAPPLSEPAEGVVTKKSGGMKHNPHLVKLDNGTTIECTSNGILEEVGAQKNKMVDNFLSKVKAPKVSDPEAFDFVEGVEGLLEGFGIDATTVGTAEELKGIFIPYAACKPLHALVQEIFIESLNKGKL